jgi:AcrR family transcriptional regulator
MVSRVSPRVADPTIRTTLIEAAARMIATEGPNALTLRRVADEVGTSTMAVYTHFGGMRELRREVSREGFARLGAHLASVRSTRDPVADLIVLGRAYFANAVTNPNLYRAMLMEHGIDIEDAAIGLDSFESLVNAIKRCIDAGRFRPADAVELATQVWALTHGVVALHLAGFLSPDQAPGCLTDAARSLFLGYGDTKPAIDRSVDRAGKRAVLS